MIPQETTFTIGQFAAIHGIHKKTLMWYDQVGLLSPAFVGENLATDITATARAPGWKPS